MALFARAPIAGEVKTRLCGPLTPQQACELHRALVRDAWETLDAFRGWAEVFLYGSREHPEWRELAGPQFRVQSGPDLGARLRHCFAEIRSLGGGPILILGSDSPAIPAAALAAWPALLEFAPAVLGPAEDGGYYAVGCREPDPAMFDGVRWSGPDTLTQTLAAFRQIGWEPALLPVHYDVDTPEDLVRLAAEPSLPPHTARWLQELSPSRVKRR
jgi:rSAM/selenodomain-associated transferase 1